MDSLDFGLFSPAPRFGELVCQSVPIIWVTLVSLWPGLLSSFLQMIWCVTVQEDDVLVSRLLPNPSVICWSDEHLVSARFAIAGLVLWCLGIPIALAIVLLRLPDRHAPDNFRPGRESRDRAMECAEDVNQAVIRRRFGYFFQGLERQFWWWDLLVKRFDVASDRMVVFDMCRKQACCGSRERLRTLAITALCLWYSFVAVRPCMGARNRTRMSYVSRRRAL